MQTIEESIATAMDVGDAAIVPFLPYILQDFWEMGTPPRIVINLIEKHGKKGVNRRVLDLGCGKGAVSVKLAAASGCCCYGIDAVSQFIDAAKEKAKEYGVDALCRFEVGDIRQKITELGEFDIIILGSIGPALGDYYTTLTRLSSHLSAEGIIIVNDAYRDSNTRQQPETSVYPWVLSRVELARQIGQAGMEWIDEFTGKYSDYMDSETEMDHMVRRCRELKIKYPEKTSLFEKFIQEQADGYDQLENDLTGSVMIFKKGV